MFPYLPSMGSLKISAELEIILNKKICPECQEHLNIILHIKVLTEKSIPVNELG